MKQLRLALQRAARGPGPSALLRRFGVDPKRYWLLLDLFAKLSDRREILNQLGRDGVTLKVITWVYLVIAALLCLVMLALQVATTTLLSGFLAFTGFLLFVILFSEAGNSLLNPVEGLILAHQPINGATYTAAKLSHLLRIVAHMVLGINALPAVAGLALPGAAWWYPFLHLPAAFAVGLTVAFTCCAIFGWLVLIVPPARLKAAGQFADMLPWVVMILIQFSGGSFRQLHLERYLPSSAREQTLLGALCVLVALASIWLGIRALSNDYLIHVAAIAHGSSGAKSPLRRSPIGAFVARYSGGQPARAGFEYVRRMMVRDWQFRRQVLPLLPAVIAPFILLARNWKTDPFSGKFTPVHLVPHVVGLWLLFLCMLLPYGSDFKGAWVFQLVPNRLYHRFTRGVHALLWLAIVLIPNALLLPALCWAWGPWQGILFVAYSLALCSLYLALTFRLIESLPFSRQMDSARGAVTLPILMLAGLVIAAAVAAQHFLLFRNPLVLLVATLILIAAAVSVTKSSLAACAESINFQLGVDSGQAGNLYVEL